MEFTRAAFEALKSEGVSRAWDGIGGSHTLVTYPPLDALEPISSAPVLSNLAGVRSVNLYVHLPFCEMSCAFCPYETQVMSGPHSNVDSYLDALAREMDLAAPGLRDARVQSLYVGGGTATVLSEAQLRRVVEELRKRFAFSPDALICVETSPNALIQEPQKIALLKQLGVKRVSVGVQTFSEMALQREGRTHGPGETLRMLDTLIRDVETVNIDLMQDMAGQTDEDLEDDIEQIAELKPAQVTWYIERLRKWQGEFPDAYHSVSRRLWLRDRMMSLGYHPRPGGRFVLAGRHDDAFKSIRCGLSSHLVGFGSSAYSHVPGYFYRNTVDTASYMNTVFQGNIPIETGARLRKVDVVAGGLVSGIRWGVELPPPDSELSEYLATTNLRLEVLMRHDMVRYDPSTKQYGITLDGPGWAYEEEICSLFVPQDIVDQIRSKKRPWWFAVTAMWVAHSVEALSLLI